MQRLASKSTMPSGRFTSARVGQIVTQGASVQWLQRSTVKKVTDVLQHMLGFFKDQLTGDEKAELLEVLDAYRGALVPLIEKSR